jgi:hypothetical protein
MHDQLMGVLQKAIDPSQALLQPISSQTLEPPGLGPPTGVHITALLRQLCCCMQVRTRAVPTLLLCCGVWRHACMMWCVASCMHDVVCGGMHA